MEEEKHILQEQFAALQRVAIAVGEGWELAEIFQETRSAIRSLVTGTRAVFFAIVEENEDTLRILQEWRSGEPEDGLLDVIEQPLVTIRIPLSKLPAEWRRRLPRLYPCVSDEVCALVEQTLGPGPSASVCRSPDIQGVAALPLRSGGMLRGLIVITLDCPTLSQESLRLGMAVANLVAMAMESHLLLRETRQRVYELEQLFEFARALTGSIELQELASLAARRFIQALNVEEASISLWDQKEDVLRTVVDILYDEEEDAFEAWPELGNAMLKDFPATRRVMETQEPYQLLISEPSGDPYELAYMRRMGTKSLIILPLIYQGRPIGVVELEDSLYERRFTSNQLSLAMTLAGQLAASIENARLLAEAQRRAIQLETAAEIARHATGILDIETLLFQSVELIRSRFDLYYAGIFLVDDEGQWAVLRAGSGQAGQEMLDAGHRLAVRSNSMIGWCTAFGQARIALDVGQEAVRFENPWLPDTRSEMALPLISHGRVIGAMTIQSTRPADFSPQDITVLQAMADQLANAIENASLHEEQRSRLNELTALYEIGRAVTAVLRQRELIEVVYREIRRFMRLSHLYVALWNRENDTIHLPLVIEKGQHFYDEEVGWEGLVGWVLRHGESLLIHDIRREGAVPPGVKPIFVGGEHPRSLVLMPLSVGDQVIGAFSIQDIRPNTYDERSVSFLKAVASQVSIAVENARLYEQERRRAEELAALNAVAGRLGQSLELQEILDAAMDAVVGVLNVNASAISLVDEEGRTLVLCAQRGLHYSHLGMEVPLQKGLSGHVVRTGEVMITGDLNNEARLAVVDFVRERIQAMAMVPMHARGQVVGVLSAMSHRPHEFTRREIALLQAVANQVGSAVENAQLFHEVREHADELEEAYARLKEADRLKDELIQNVSHELRTPLTFIKGYVQLLVSEEMGPLTEEQRNSLDVVARKTEHLTRLVEDFITLETVREETLDVVEVSLDHLLKSAVEISRPTVLAAGIQLEEQIPSNVGVVEVDAARINQVMDNLLSNAIKFSPSGGVITVRLREEGDTLRVEVADTGIGIPPDKVGRVFERFYQVDGSSRRRFSGAGLGLAIVKCIIEAHGGEVGVESSLGEGSTFYFTLPKAD